MAVPSLFSSAFRTRVFCDVTERNTTRQITKNITSQTNDQLTYVIERSVRISIVWNFDDNGPRNPIRSLEPSMCVPPMSTYHEAYDEHHGGFPFTGPYLGDRLWKCKQKRFRKELGTGSLVVPHPSMGCLVDITHANVWLFLHCSRARFEPAPISYRFDKPANLLGSWIAERGAGGGAKTQKTSYKFSP